MKRYDVFLDAGTPKHVIFAMVIQEELRRKSIKSLLIVRDETQAIALADTLHLSYVKAGTYGGGGIRKKLEASISRMRELLEIVDEYGPPKVWWTHGEVAGVRVAFGLSIPIIYCNDTPYNTAVCKLTVPLSNYLVTPSACGKEVWMKYGASEENIVTYNGVEETAWVKPGAAPKTRVWGEIGLRNERVIVVRGPEYKASYYTREFPLLRLVSELASSYRVVYIPRYREEVERFSRVPNVHVLKRVVYTPDLLGCVDLFISSGGTMASEAALQGTPTISYHFWTPSLRFLHDNGFPVKHISDPMLILEESRKIMENPEKYRVDTTKLLEKLESPIPIVTDLIERFL